MKGIPEKDSEIAKLASHLISQAEKAMTIKKKEPAEESNNTTSQNRDADEEK